ncbi:hypothetical protein D8674_002963 [Pyrus ussuriensis x Pyrus communis]|uniref:Uncharacterized protein n=1 Tax=Pyrus ussuriensis x Pyrus communis TaxID=2448454 RepID=A0A5N5FFR2_9ROSA|nr:hypothetical protein D8674_002963 [Pyrus ussuriensis x Pyrus communis]
MTTSTRISTEIRVHRVFRLIRNPVVFFWRRRGHRSGITVAAFPIDHEGQVEEEAHEETEEEAPKDEAEIQVAAFCSVVRIAAFSCGELTRVRLFCRLEVAREGLLL